VLYTRSELRAALVRAGARGGSWERPDTAEILAAVALAASPAHGCSDFDREDGNKVTCFQIATRPTAPSHTPRDRHWVTRGLTTACLAAVALTHMNGLRSWPQYASGEYRRFLPEAFPPPILRPEGQVPYQQATVFPGLTLRQLMKACGWIAPSNADADEIARGNGHEKASDIPAGSLIRIPVQRGW
jgi:hypothetical protein